MTPEEFRQYGHQIIDWLADYRTGVGDRPVMSQVEPGEVRNSLPAEPPDMPEPFASILNDLNEKIMPGVTHWNHPNFYAYFSSNGMLASVLGDLISSGIGGIGLNWQALPALTEVEEVVTDWMRQMVGLSPAWEGVIQDTASTSSLVALICAREWATGNGQMATGLQGVARPLTVYTSIQSHSSVKKAALLAGFGLEYVRFIESDENYALDAARLAQAVEQDLEEGRRPCAVVATTGTTATTANDPIAAIAQITKRHDMWLHVDAAMAGSAMILPECRWMWAGIEEADSLVLNPHKWLGTVFDCSLFYTRKAEHLIRVMSTSPSYLRTAADEKVKNYRDWGIPLGRRFRALKLWCLIRDEGVSGLQARIRRDMAFARWLGEQITAAPDWEVLAPVVLQTVCARHTPHGLTGDDLEAHTLRWADQINRSGAAYVTAAELEGQWMVRVAFGAESTTMAHVEALWKEMQSTATASSRNHVPLS